MAPDTEPQTSPLNPLTVVDRLRFLFPLIGVGVNVEASKLGEEYVVSFSSMWLHDADKLARALCKIPEVRPYLQGSATTTTGGEQ